MDDVKLVAIDLDGTLLDDRKRLSPNNRQALDRCLRQGVIIALASARDCASIRLKVPLQLPGLYYIGSGGALIFDVGIGRMRVETFLPPQATLTVIDFLKDYNNPIFLNYRDDYWVDRYNDRVQMIEERYNLKTHPFTDPLATGSPIMRVSLAAPVAVLERATERALSALDHCVQVSLASHDWLDFLEPAAGKGELLGKLQQSLGITKDQTAAIGDYDSDLSLFERARHRVAMGNAVDSVKAASTYITANNNEDGVAHILNLIA